MNIQQGKPNRPGSKDREKFIRYNWKIKAGQCRVIEDGKPPTIMNTRDAVEYAQSIGFDLVEVGYDPRSGVSTAKICEYGKYVYDIKRREKLAKKQARANTAELKCLQMHLTTDTADYERMVEQAKSFLAKGDRVKLSLRFRGRRELSNIGYAKELMKGLLSRFDGLAVLDSQPALNGKELSCIIRKA